jgi:ATP-binding cassette subfamily B protein
MELLNAPVEIFSPSFIKEQAESLPAEIKLSELSFYYPSRPDIAALDTFDLSISKGKVVALVGPSGAGKSSLFALLQRFYDPQEGSISFGGCDIRELDLTSLRRQIGVVEQHPTLFTGDVLYNIRYGMPDASDDEVIEAAKAAHADEFIGRLPDGYKSDLGEQGVRLSGGQRQRIAIARALLKNPKILLLDEATSALDAESEKKVQLALEKLMVGRTTVIIAHRLSTILHADEIVVMDSGQKIAQGSHEELLKNSSLYARLANLQFSDRGSQKEAKTLDD